MEYIGEIDEEEELKSDDEDNKTFSAAKHLENFDWICFQINLKFYFYIKFIIYVV